MEKIVANRAFHCFLLLAWASSNFQARILAGDAAEESRRPGLLARYSVGGQSLYRVKDDLFAIFRGQAARAGDAKAITLRGWIFVVQPGKYRFDALLKGGLTLKVRGNDALLANSDAPGWVEGKPISLEFGDNPIEITYRPPRMGGVLKLCWLSEQFAREPIPAARLSHEPDPEADDFERGRALVTRHRCAACHQGIGEPLRSPSLAHFSGLTSSRWLREYLTDDGNGSTGHSPEFDFNAMESQAITAFILSSQTLPHPMPTQGDKDAGRELVQSVGCLACHRIQGIGEASIHAGPDLSSVGDRRSPAFFPLWLKTPEKFNPAHRMPTFELSDKEVADISSYLASMGTYDATSNVNQTLVEEGRQLVQSHRCDRCHAIEMNGAAGSRVELRFEGEGCLAGPDRNQNRPGYHLSSADQTAVKYYVRKKSLTEQVFDDRGRNLILENNCFGCHPRGAANGFRDVVQELGATDPREQAKLVPPSLDGIGDKLTPAALEGSIRGEASRRRPWLAPRMPRFPFSQAEARSLATYFHEHDDLPSESIPVGQSNEETRLAAQRLVGPAGFGCMSCHAIGDSVPAGVESGARGPDLRNLSSRIQPDWFRRWIRNPSRIWPGVEMPAINLASPGILDGNLDTQIAALWDGLNHPHFQPPIIDAVQTLTALGSDRPIIFRDIFEHAENVHTTRSFGAGLVNGHSLLIDLDSFSLRRWWMGDFAHERTRGKTWYWQTAGEMLIDQPQATPLIGLLKSGRIELPTPNGQSVARLLGWKENEDRVQFRARADFDAGPVIVAVEIKPADRGLQLTMRAESHHDGVPVLLLPSEFAHDTHVKTSVGTAIINVLAPDDGKRDSRGFAAYPLDRERTVRFTLESSVQPVSVVKKIPEVAPARKEFNVIPGYEVVRLPLPDGPMPTGLVVQKDRALLVTSLKGGVFRAYDQSGDGEHDSYQKISHDLSAPFGVMEEGDDVLVAHKPELVRLKDRDRDGFAEEADVVASGWGVTFDYHDWVVGPVPAGNGRYYLATSCQQDKRSEASAAARGKLLLTQTDGSFEEMAAGLRFPMGLAVNSRGDLFATDNQGVTNPFNELNHLRPGRHYGFFSRLEPERPAAETELPAVQIPHPLTGSVNGLALVPADGSFGPFAGHFIGAEYTTRRLTRMSLQRVGDTYQGCVYPFGESDASSIEKDQTFLGPISLTFAPDGTLYVGSMIDSGWGGGNNRGAIERVRREGPIPFGIREIRSWSGGFDIDFTTPADPKLASNADAYSISSYRRIHTGGYATPDRDRASAKVLSAELSPDNLSVRLSIEPVRLGFVYDIGVGKIQNSSLPAYPSVASFTLHGIP